MKRVLKLISLFILLLIVNIGVVRAANNACGNVTISTDKIPSTDNDVNSFGKPTYKYSFKINNSTSVTAYCHNPGIHDFNIENPQTNNTMNPVSMGCASLIFDPTGTADVNNVFGVGLMYILNSGKTYNVIYIAENMYEMLFPIKNSKSYDTDEVKILKYYINTHYNSIKDYLDKLGRYIGSYNVIDGTLSGAASKCSGNCATNDEMKEAVNLVQKALEAATLYARGDVSTPKTEMSSPIQTRTEKLGKTVNTITYNIDIKDFPKYDKSKTDNPSVILGFTCNNCKENGIKDENIKILLDNKSISVKNLKNTNLLEKYAENGQGKIKFAVEFTSDAEKCDEISYSISINYKYNAKSLVTDNKDLNNDEAELIEEILKALNSTGYEVGECTSREKCQGFYVLDKSGNNSDDDKNPDGDSHIEVNRQSEIEKKLEITNTISTCNNIKKPTENKCPSKLSNVDCVACEENSNTITIKEGYTYANDNFCDTSGEQLNISKCIVDEKAADELGNKYKDTELSKIAQKGGANVYCKEDYTLTLPGSKVSEPGRYFPLDPTSIDGTKSCYSSEYNSPATIQEKVKTANEDLITDFNKYLEKSALAHCLESGLSNGDCKFTKNSFVQSSIPCTYQPGKAGTPLQEDGRTVCQKINGTPNSCSACHIANCSYINGVYYAEGNEPQSSVSGYLYQLTATVSTTYTPYNSLTCDDGKPLEAKQSFTYINDSYCYTNSGEANADYVNKFNSWSDEFKESLAEEIGVPSNISCERVGNVTKGGAWLCSGLLGTGIIGDIEADSSSIENDIDTWNNSFNWNMNYDFNPTVRFWYQEEYMYNPNTDKMAQTSQTNYDKNIKYCDGTVSDNYEKCNNGDWSDTISKTSVDVCSCNTDSGCKPVSKEIYKAKYVKQSQEKKATYQAPNGFYSRHPYGDILTANPGQSDKITNSTELDHVLPLSINTIGTRNYLIWVEGLGEYYNKETNKTNDTTGRIWGSNNSVLTALLKKGVDNKCYNSNSALVSENTSKFVVDGNSENVVHDKGVYVCKYTTDCPHENSCTPPSDSPDGQYHCQNGEVCTEEQYDDECNNTCANPSDSPDGQYHCQNGEVCTEEQYDDECNNTCANPKVENDKYTYCDDLPFGSNDATYQCRENVTEAQYKAECCPNGNCPPSITYKCAITTKEDNPEKLIYYDKYGNETTKDIYEAQCGDCPDCPVTCTYCLYDGKKLNVQYRPVTSEDLNPNDRELGVNWKWDNNIDTTMELKAYVTTDEIENAGDKIFDIEDSQYDNQTTGDEAFAMKVVMDGKLISRLRSINKEKGFASNTLKCYDYKDKNTDNVYENIYCYSTIIDQLINDGYDIKFTVNRPKDEGRENADHEQYFTSFASKTATEWKLGTEMKLAIADTSRDKFGIEINRTNGSLIDYHVGPSWK